MYKIVRNKGRAIRFASFKMGKGYRCKYMVPPGFELQSSYSYTPTSLVSLPAGSQPCTGCCT